MISFVAQSGASSDQCCLCDDVTSSGDISTKVEVKDDGSGGDASWFAIVAEIINKYDDNDMAAKAKEALVMLPIILNGVVGEVAAYSSFLYVGFDSIVASISCCSLWSTTAR